MEATRERTSTIRSVQKHRLCTQSRSGNIARAYSSLAQRAKALTLHVKLQRKHCACILPVYAYDKSIDTARKVVVEELCVHTSTLTQRAKASTVHLKSQRKHCACILLPFAAEKSIGTAHTVVMGALCVHTSTLRCIQKHQHCTQSRIGSIERA